MYHAVTSGTFHGMDSFLVQVEVDISNGLPGMEMVGCLASEVKETKERVRVGLKNSGYELPVKRITVSLSPADIRKDGSGFDLPVAIGILGATLLKGDSADPKVIIMGELGLDGVIKKVRGILPILMKASEEGITHCILPFDNRCEASNVKGVKLYPVRTLEEAFRIYEALFCINNTDVIKKGLVRGKTGRTEKRGITEVSDGVDLTEETAQNVENSAFFLAESEISENEEKIMHTEDFATKNDEKLGKCRQVLEENEYNFARNIAESDTGTDDVIGDDKITLDFNQIIGQEHAKRAALISAAGFHNLLLFGPPGSGKSMVAQRMPTIMKNMCYEECLDVTKIYSVAGLLQENTALIKKRPFLSPHHTVSDAALVGGGTVPRPGMITLAHRGILFLDELPEFGRYKLDLLRQPLEDKRVQISRMAYSCNYEADFLLVAAMNPCPCGFFPDRSKCNCTEKEIKRYLGRVSGPLLDRIDLSVEVGRMTWEQVTTENENYVNRWDSHNMHLQVERAVDVQMARNGGKWNSALNSEEIAEYCVMDRQAQVLLKKMFEKMELSMRSLNKLKKVARTIADLDGEEMITPVHLSEAAVLNRGLERWKKLC